MPTGFAGLLMSLMVCRYGTPLRNMSPCGSEPRLGTEPKLGENASFSEVRLSSRTLSRGGGGGGGAMGNCVGVTGLSGRKIVLKPWPFHFPRKKERGPRLGAPAEALASSALFKSRFSTTSPKTKSSGREILASCSIGSLINFLQQLFDPSRFESREF